MKPYLLDVNVLLALAWPFHVHHPIAVGWLKRNLRAGFRTCPLTQMGFVRISMNAGFTNPPASPSEALALLDQFTALPHHGFWPDDIPLSHALHRRMFFGHQQVTDSYLVAMAEAHDGVFATLDRRTLALPRATPDIVELIQEA